MEYSFTGEFQRLDEGVLEEVSKCPLGIKEIYIGAIQSVSPGGQVVPSKGH